MSAFGALSSVKGRGALCSHSGTGERTASEEDTRKSSESILGIVTRMLVALSSLHSRCTHTMQADLVNEIGATFFITRGRHPPAPPR